MQIGSPFTPSYNTLNEHQPPPNPQESNATRRHIRAIDPTPSSDQELVQETVQDSQSPGGYREQSVNPDPGKKVGAGEKNTPPVDLGPNISVDPITQKIADEFKSVAQEASVFLKNKFAEMAEKAKTPEEKEKWNIDPDKTYLVTYDYNSTGKKPYPAKIIKRISLTQALITNAQDTPKGQGYLIPFFSGGPNVIVKPDLQAHSPGIFDFPSRFSPYNEKADTTHTYQGIYKESDTSPTTVYNETNQSSITPAQLKELIWNADYKKPYDKFLEAFWSSHEEKYPTLVKASLAKSAMAQHQEGSLTTESRELIMRATGLPGHQESWPDIKYEDLQKNSPKDPNIEVGLLKLGHYQSTDLVYITDTKVKIDAQGNKVPPLTLLYIPGNSSPIHTFKNQADMKDWLAKQMADPAKRAALAGHFPQKDKPNGYARAGIDETLTGLGTWPEKRETPGGLFSYDHRAFSGYWDPQTFITTEPTKLPFDEVTKRQKERSYADAAVTITSDADVTKKEILSGLEKAAKVAMFLTPLALAIPEVALALDAFYLASGATEVGIGVDDVIEGKPQGTEHIVFGLFNALPVVAPRTIRAGRRGMGIGEEIEPYTIKSEQEPAPASVHPDAPSVHTDAPAPPNGENTILLKREVGPDGRTVLIPEGLSSENARILRREKYTDVVIGDNVYRYDPKHPDVLTEVGTRTDSEPLSGFEQNCGASGARLRRDLNDLCYTKWIEQAGTPVFQDAQAIEHRRLVPSPEQNGQPRTVIHDHRLYRVDPNTDQLIPQSIQSQVFYRYEVKGSIVADPDFGFDTPGQTRSINDETLVVNLGQISDMSNDQRTLRGVKVKLAGMEYVVAEADTGIFYAAELNHTGAPLNFQRITADNNPISSWLIEQHDVYKDAYGWAANGAPNNDIVVLPPMETLEKKIIAENKLTAPEVERLRQALDGLSAEKKREVLLNIVTWGKKVNIPTALKSIKLEPLNTPADLNTRSVSEQHQFYAEKSLAAIDKQFDATGVKSANQRIPSDLADDVRNVNANEIVTWLYTRTNAPNYSEVILKTGAGNCDQMAQVAVDTINISGGEARIAQVKGHTFAVVGGPKGNVGTSGFSEPEWADAWIVDPWAGITCPAKDYPVQFKQKMKEWSAAGKQIFISDGGTPPRSVWKDPIDTAWINSTVYGDAQVFSA